MQLRRIGATSAGITLRPFPVRRSGSHTEELLALAALLNDLNEARLQLLDGGDVVGENTHLSGRGGDVNLNTVDPKTRQYVENKAFCGAVKRVVWTR